MTAETAAELYAQYGLVGLVIGMLLWFSFQSLRGKDIAIKSGDEKIENLQAEVRSLYINQNKMQVEITKFSEAIIKDMAEHNKKLLEVLEQNQNVSERNTETFMKIWGHAAAIIDFNKKGL